MKKNKKDSSSGMSLEELYFNQFDSLTKFVDPSDSYFQGLDKICSRIIDLEERIYELDAQLRDNMINLECHLES